MPKKILFTAFFLVAFYPEFSYSQEMGGRISNKQITGVKDQFSWSIQKENRGYLMFLNIPYRSGDSLESVSLTVTKDYNRKKPFFISVTAPALRSKSTCISFVFAKTVPRCGKKEIIIDSSTYLNLPVSKNKKRFYSARVYIPDTIESGCSNNLDLFANLMFYNHLFILFTDSNGPEEVVIPLFSFQKQYNSLVTKDEKPLVELPYSNIKLTPEEAKDDTVFDDGSIPSPWRFSGINDPLQFKQFLKYLKVLVKNNNRNEIARFIDYPVLQAKRTTRNIKNENDFVNNYDKLFNEKVKSALENQKLNQIFRNYQGAMVGGGQLWFEETPDGEFKVIAINY